jgi:8-oxo-dGTP pyrophosphatase MutT (NUDIX family)
VRRIYESGAIVIRRDAQGSQILLVRAKKSPDSWIFPKGHREGDESPEDAALREAFEEAGIRGVVIGAVGGPLEFMSGAEPVSVQYYLIYARSALASPEGRLVQWCSTSEAKQLLTHKDAQQLLESLDAEIAWWTSTHDSRAERDPFAQLMLAEFEHAGESLLRNEESGEKRVTFFLTFAGAVGAAVGFLVGKDGPLQDHSRLLVSLMLVILLLLGYGTFLRVVVRNAASDRYKRRLSRVRQYFLEAVDDPHRHFMAFAPFEHSWRRSTSWRSLGSGGWMETMAAVNALLAAALGAFITNWLQTWLRQLVIFHQFVTPLLGALVLGGVVWYVLIARGNKLYKIKMCEQYIPVGYEP